MSWYAAKRCRKWLVVATVNDHYACNMEDVIYFEEGASWSLARFPYYPGRWSSIDGISCSRRDCCPQVQLLNLHAACFINFAFPLIFSQRVLLPGGTTVIDNKPLPSLGSLLGTQNYKFWRVLGFNWVDCLLARSSLSSKHSDVQPQAYMNARGLKMWGNRAARKFS